MKALFFSLLLAACAANAPAPTLQGSDWGLAGASGERPPTLQFREDGARGSTGCNSWFGTVEMHGAALSFEGVGGTEMACAEPAMDVEHNYYEMLRRVRSHRLDGDVLVLLDETGGELARFDRVASQEH